jgi:SAM-dependent methyltransferase
MTEADNASCASWYERSHGDGGFSAQRLYSNEELLRFFGRHYFALDRDDRKSLRGLEVGCGSGTNLWMIACEGLAATESTFRRKVSCSAGKCWRIGARLRTYRVADMTSMPCSEDHIDVLVDIFSSYCLDERGFARFLSEVARILRRGGQFYSYAPSKQSTTFRDSGPSPMIDASTLDGIRRQGAPFNGNLYPFRLISPEEYQSAVASSGMTVTYRETVGRTYGRKLRDARPVRPRPGWRRLPASMRATDLPSCYRIPKAAWSAPVSSTARTRPPATPPGSMIAACSSRRSAIWCRPWQSTR